MRRRLAGASLVLAAVAAALAASAFFTGGFRVYVLGIPLSARGADRAAFVALALAIVGTFLHDRLLGKVRSTAESLGRRIPLLQALVALAAAFLLWAGVTFGTRATGGADVYGYVTQAELWRRGDLRIHQDFVASIPWPNAEWSFSPLGYRPGEHYTIVPTYPPGLPLLILLFSSVLGEIGTYAVPWVAGAALVLLTYALGTRLSGPAVGTTAAVSLAVNPTVLMLTLSLMSDVPVAALWTASVLAASRASRAGAAASGVLAGIAILVRPNLLLLAVAPFVVAVWAAGPARRGPAGRALAFVAGCAPFPLFVGWLFNELYGSPLTSGYGDSSALFAWAHVPVNLARYPQWLLESQGPTVFLFLLTPVFMLRRDARVLLRGACLTIVALVFGCYLLYLPFDAWWWTRFLLPAYPFMFILAAEVVWLGAERFGTRTRTAAMLLFALTMIYYGGRSSYHWKVHLVGQGEQKYAEIGRHVDRTLPRNAILITMQHSGTVRYYSGRLTVRYDYIDADWLDRAIDHLTRAGYDPFILLDDWELPIFREKFASQRQAAVVAEEPRFEPCTHTTYLYRVAPRPGEPAAIRIPAVQGCETSRRE